MTKINKSILKKVERIFKKSLRQRRDIGEIQFDFMPECATAKCHIILKQLQEKYIANLNFVFVDFNFLSSV